MLKRDSLKLGFLLGFVAPEVKYTSRGSAPIRAATAKRASSTRSFAAMPGQWVVEAGFACSEGADSQSAIAAATRGSTGVVAA